MQGITGTEWFGTLQKAMDLLVVQNRVIAGNISNVNTPGYSRLNLNFQQELARSLQAGNATELRNGEAMEGARAEEVIPEADQASPRRADGNNVALEKEMVDLAESNEVYTALARIASKNFKMARYIISGGR